AQSGGRDRASARRGTGRRAGALPEVETATVSLMPRGPAARRPEPSRGPCRSGAAGLSASWNPVHAHILDAAVNLGLLTRRAAEIRRLRFELGQVRRDDPYHRGILRRGASSTPPAH